MPTVKSIFILLSFIACFPLLTRSAADECVYTVYVRTGSIIKGGTDSTISLTLSDPYGSTVAIPNLETWGGLMEPSHDYFERGNLDIFSGRGSCLDGPICYMNLTSDGTGSGHGWYCNYVEVTSTGPHITCKQQLFTVEQWLATDTSPYVLTAIRDFCYSVRRTSDKDFSKLELGKFPSL
ncbi:PLAT domain-containing protein 3-like [Aristolochia californica]|uniref:PLAT domain-containing protein 3-like n=1 Tax=Aristolochia californica TaxID=171875 RepID=UPI0035E2E6F6